MNSLHPLKGSWRADSPDGGSLSDSPSPTAIEISSAKQGTPFNAIYEPSLLPSAVSDSFFEIKIDKLEGSLGIGVARPSEFRPGWKARGMFYNGNLSNGSAGLRIGFGDRPTAGDTVGVCARKENERLSVVYYLNGRCLGEAFRLADPGSEPYLPCVHVDGIARCTFAAPQALPTVPTREEEVHADPFLGGWRVKKAFAGPELGEFPLPTEGDIVLTLKGGGDASGKGKEYSLSAKVANRINAKVIVTGKAESFDTIEVGQAMSTKMMPPPDLVPVEQYLMKSLPTFYKMIASERGDLIMTGPAAELICGRYSETFEPLDKY